MPQMTVVQLLRRLHFGLLPAASSRKCPFYLLTEHICTVNHHGDDNVINSCVALMASYRVPLPLKRRRPRKHFIWFYGIFSYDRSVELGWAWYVDILIQWLYDKDASMHQSRLFQTISIVKNTQNCTLKERKIKVKIKSVAALVS